MMTPVVLKVPLNKKTVDQDYVLVNVIPNGKAALDLKLEATEGVSPYVGSVSQSRITKLQDKNSPIDVKQWETILLFTLLRQNTGTELDLENLETIATVTSNEIVLTLRKNVSGIHQVFGKISLKKDDTYEIDTLSWTSTAVDHTSLVEQELRSLRKQYSEQGKDIERMNNQLEELNKAKVSDESTLIAKFCELLNFKKLKIRDQQRLLATAKVDRNRADTVNTDRSPPTSKRRPPAASNASKRKKSTSSSDSESAFESMEIDKSRPDTADASETTVSEDDPGNPGSGSASESEVGARNGPSAVAIRSKDEASGVDNTSPPPRRTLPFGRLGGGTVAEAALAGGTQDKEGDVDEDATDDEL